MFGVTSIFVNLSETMAGFGFLVGPQQRQLFLTLQLHIDALTLSTVWWLRRHWQRQ